MINSVAYHKDNGYSFYGHNNNATYSFTLPTETENVGYVIRVKPVGSSQGQVRLDVVFVLSSDTPSEYQALESSLRGSQTHPTIVGLERVTTEGAFGGTVPGVKVEILDTRYYPSTAAGGASAPTAAPIFTLAGSTDANNFIGGGQATRDGFPSAMGTQMYNWTKQGSFYSFVIEVDQAHLSGNSYYRVDGLDSSESLVGSLQSSDYATIDVSDANATYEMSLNPTLTITGYSGNYGWQFSGDNGTTLRIINPGYSTNAGGDIIITKPSGGGIAIDIVNDSSQNFYVHSTLGYMILALAAGSSTTYNFNSVHNSDGTACLKYSKDQNLSNPTVGEEGFICVDE